MASLSNNEDTVVIVVVFVSFGCFLGLGACLFALWCFIKKLHKRKRMVQETETVDIDEHLKWKEAIVKGPHGSKAVVLSMEEDVHVDDRIKKNEVDLGDKAMHAKSGEINVNDLEAGQSSPVTTK